VVHRGLRAIQHPNPVHLFPVLKWQYRRSSRKAHVETARRWSEFQAVEVDHRRLFLDVPAKGAKLDVTVETRDAGHAEEIYAVLTAEGYQPVRIETGNAME
jgi:hypothetical protein